MKLLYLAAALNLVVRAADMELVEIASDFTTPTAITSAHDGSGRLFVTEHSGTVRIWNPDGTTTLFLDIRDRVFPREDFCCNEQGLLGIAFPPGGGPKSHVFLSYVDRTSNCVVSRFEISQETGLADPGSEQVIQKVFHPDENHFGGTIAFHPTDGLLYWTIGDGSAGFDVRFSQDPTSVFGKVLRFDPYAEPVSTMEVYALGLRNPWKFSFDTGSGDLFIGDVGENTFEEINYVPNGTKAGTLNFGWGTMEGNDCYEYAPCSKEGLTLPIVAYPHDPEGCSVTAGEMYRGTKNPDWQGKYFFSDFCFGQIFETHREGDGWVTSIILPRTDHQISAFGQDEDGEIYVVDYLTGKIYRFDTPLAMPRTAQKRARSGMPPEWHPPLSSVPATTSEGLLAQ
jgi:glucose/arabinose dehydrogenase